MAIANPTTKPADNLANQAPARSQEPRKRQKAASEYKKSLVEKQTLKNLYGLSERQFKRYVQETLEKMQRVQNVSDELIKRLEIRLDNVVYRLGLAKTRRQSRQMVNHSYFLVNGKPVNIPSFQMKKGDLVTVKPAKRKKPIFNDLAENLKKTDAPTWISFSKETLEGKVVGDPTMAEANPPVEISLIFEFYS